MSIHSSPIKMMYTHLHRNECLQRIYNSYLQHSSSMKQFVFSVFVVLSIRNFECCRFGIGAVRFIIRNYINSRKDKKFRLLKSLIQGNSGLQNSGIFNILQFSNFSGVDLEPEGFDY